MDSLNDKLGVLRNVLTAWVGTCTIPRKEYTPEDGPDYTLEDIRTLFIAHVETALPFEIGDAFSDMPVTDFSVMFREVLKDQYPNHALEYAGQDGIARFDVSIWTPEDDTWR